MIVRPNEQAYVDKSNSSKTFTFERNKKFFKKNKRFDDALMKGKIKTHKKFKCAKKD